MIEIINSNEMWTEGHTTIQGTTYKVSFTVAARPSRYGIAGGRVIRLRVRPINSEAFCIVYDHAWEIKPHSKAGEEIFNEIIKRYN